MHQPAEAKALLDGMRANHFKMQPTDQEAAQCRAAAELARTEMARQREEQDLQERANARQQHMQHKAQLEADINRRRLDEQHMQDRQRQQHQEQAHEPLRQRNQQAESPSFASQSNVRHEHVHGRGDAHRPRRASFHGDSDSEDGSEDEDQGSRFMPTMFYRECATYALHLSKEIFGPEDRVPCVNGRIRHWLDASAQVRRLTATCILAMASVSKAKGIEARLSPLMMLDTSHTDLLMDIVRGSVQSSAAANGPKYGSNKLETYCVMWEHITSIANDAIKLHQYLDCHRSAVRDRNEVLVQQLLSDGICPTLAHTKSHRAIEVNECAHHFLREYFNHLNSLRDRGFSSTVITAVACHIEKLMNRVVRMTPEPNDRHALILATVRLCRMFERLMSDRFETPEILCILGPKMAIANTNKITSLEARLRSLEGGGSGNKNNTQGVSSSKATDAKARAAIDAVLKKTITTLKADGKVITKESEGEMRAALYSKEGLKVLKQKQRRNTRNG